MQATSTPMEAMDIWRLARMFRAPSPTRYLPTGNIDPELSYEIVDLLNEINKCGTTILMVTHEHGLVSQFDHRVIGIEKGRITLDQGPKGPGCRAPGGVCICWRRWSPAKRKPRCQSQFDHRVIGIEKGRITLDKKGR